MTNAQKWVSVFLFLFVILLVLAKLTRKEDDTYSDIDESTYQESENSSEPLSPIEAIIRNNDCKMCHGSDLAGSGSGPSLIKLSVKWSKEDLKAFMKDPSSFKDDPKMAASKGKYRMSMPPADKLTEEELDILVDHLLSLK